MLLDTSGLLAFLFAAEAAHWQPVGHLLRPVPKVVTGYVYAELVALAAARKYPRPPVLAFLDDLTGHPYRYGWPAP